MKRLIVLLGVVMVAALSPAATVDTIYVSLDSIRYTPLQSSIEGGYQVICDRTISAGNAWDTLATSDSITFLTAFTPRAGYSDYRLQWSAWTGTGTDSVEFSIITYSLSPSGVVIDSCTDTSFAFANSEASNLIRSAPLHFGQKGIWGSSYTVRAVATNRNGSRLIWNKVWLYCRKPLIRMH